MVRAILKLAISLKNLIKEDLNFLITNRIPHRWSNQFMGWFSKIEHPWISQPAIRFWKLFSDLDLTEAKSIEFNSLHDCFTRELKPGARPVANDSHILISPCDAIVGSCGKVQDGQLLQAKGFHYRLQDLLCDQNLVETYRNGTYVTLRLTATMYHHFHAPYDCAINEVTYISGDTWNVNPIALKRVRNLFCKNERAVIETHLSNTRYKIALVPVAAILVASIRLRFLDVLLNLKYRGPNVINCNARFNKGDDMGWFEHGSTIIVFAPEGFSLMEQIEAGQTIQMGQALMRLPASSLM